MTSLRAGDAAISCTRKRQNALSKLALIGVLCALAGMSAHAQKEMPVVFGTYSVMYTFTNGADGSHPYAGLIADPAGNLYGAAADGGNFTGRCQTLGCGVIFKIDPAGNESTLYTFTGPDGSGPVGNLVRDSAGNLYGAALQGGNFSLCAPYGCGVIFRIDSAGHETVLHTFSGADGADPSGGLTLSAAGILYGTTEAGGAQGVVYSLDPTGNETVLYSFTGGLDGGNPLAGLLQDAAGNLYGTTRFGGDFSGSCAQTHGCGVVFELDPQGTETVLRRFTGGADGAYPFAGLIQDAAGNLYGTTLQAGNFSGSCSPNGCGVVFKLNPQGDEFVLDTFSGSDGGEPTSGLIRDPGGNLYGTTYFGGSGFGVYGVVFKLLPSGQESIFYSFTGGKDGASPEAGLLPHNGFLYGTTYYGGARLGSSGYGVVFKFGPL